MLKNAMTFIGWWSAISLMALALVLGAPAFGLSATESEPFVIHVEDTQCVPAGQVESEAFLRGPSFAFIDHELARAGGYGLVRASQIVDGSDFDFVDHELAHAGGYALRPALGVPLGADLSFSDHELAHAGGYGLVRASQIVDGVDFGFLDHELAYAGGYAFCGRVLTSR